MNKVLAEIRKSPGKSTTLGLFALVAAWTWSGILLGEEPGRNPGNAPQPAVNQPLAKSSPSPSIAPLAGADWTVHNFDQALERLKTWRGPLGLHLDAMGESEVILPNQAQSEALSASATPLVGMGGVPRLTGTAILPNHKWALFGPESVQEGEWFGRYFVQEVHPREVHLLDGSRRLVLQLHSGAQNPLLSNQTP